MRRLATLAAVLVFILVCPLADAQQRKIKVIADQDSAGPQGTNLLSLLMLLRAPQIDLLGITTVSGDQWVEPSVVEAAGPLAKHVHQIYLETQPPFGATTWSMMWDELPVASIMDPSVIQRSEMMYLDVDIEHGPLYGNTVIWRKPSDIPTFFLPYSGGPGPVDRQKWMSHLTPPPQLH